MNEHNGVLPFFIWRAHVHADRSHPELTVFVEALGYEQASEKMAMLCRQLRGLASAPVSELFYSLRSGRELLDSGTSADEVLRLFETEWRGSEVSGWVEHPVFATSNPRPLIDAWSRRHAPNVVSDIVPLLEGYLASGAKRQIVDDISAAIAEINRLRTELAVLGASVHDRTRA